MKRMTYEELIADDATYEAVRWWGKEDDGSLTHEDFQDAIEEIIDDRHPDPPEGTIEVYGFVSMGINQPFQAEIALLHLLEMLDEEHADPDGGNTLATATMKEAAAVFVGAVCAEYKTWMCVPAVCVTVDVLAWCQEQRPDWLKEG